MENFAVPYVQCMLATPTTNLYAGRRDMLLNFHWTHCEDAVNWSNTTGGGSIRS